MRGWVSRDPNARWTLGSEWVVPSRVAGGVMGRLGSAILLGDGWVALRSVVAELFLVGWVSCCFAFTFTFATWVRCPFGLRVFFAFNVAFIGVTF